MKYYAIADIHGRLDLLKLAFEAITKDILTKDVSEAKIITLGDYIDRGPESKQVLDFLVSWQDEPNLICLQGNHEQIMLQSITTPLHPDWWVSNGGDTTLGSYGWGGEPYIQLSYEVVPKDHLKWLASLPLYYETEKQVFVHAGIPQWDMNLDKASATNQEKMQWMLYGKQDSGGWKGKHVVHGHRQFEDGPHVWLNAKNGGRTDLDTWAYYTGRLVVGVFDDTQLHAIDYIEIKE